VLVPQDFDPFPEPAPLGRGQVGLFVLGEDRQKVDGLGLDQQKITDYRLGRRAAGGDMAN
jgi:hypothetical protein